MDDIMKSLPDGKEDSKVDAKAVQGKLTEAEEMVR